MSVLEIKNLHVDIEGKKILKGVNLTLKTGEVAAIMGPNGTGKSTLSAAIMGNPNYEVTKGEILFDGVNILELDVDERARMGLFLAMQYPSEIPGITNAEFLRAAMNAGKEDDEKISVLLLCSFRSPMHDFIIQGPDDFQTGKNALDIAILTFM